MMVAPNEINQAEAYNAELGVDGVLVQTHTPTQLCAIMQYVKFAVGPESGFIHLALAANSPHVIAFYNVLPPKATFPVDDPKHLAIIEDVPCAPCYLYKAKDHCPHNVKCMQALPAKKVLNFIQNC
jgi:ADP-heptose:LPS heptosyltransferase